MSKPTYIQDEMEFDKLLTTESILIVDFTATWCGPCKMIAPLIDRLAEEYSDRAKVCKLDIDSNKKIARRFGIRSIPVVLFFKYGELVSTQVGTKSYGDFSSILEEFL